MFGLIALGAVTIPATSTFASDSTDTKLLADTAEPPYRLLGYALAGGPEPEPLKLRKFDAEALGIELTPGNSAASLAGLLETLSDRQSAVGNGPSLILASKPVTLDRLLGGGRSIEPRTTGRSDKPN